MIYGRLEGAAKPKRKKEGFFSKLFNKEKSPSCSDMGTYTLITYPVRELKKTIIDVFDHFLEESFENPDERDRQILAYIKDAEYSTLSVYLRSEEGENRTESYVQVTFSGSAGMGEVSAEIAAHWFTLGYERSFGDELKKTLKTEFNFHAERIESNSSNIKKATYNELCLYALDDPEYGIEVDGYLHEMGDFSSEQVVFEEEGVSSSCQCSLCSSIE